MKVPSLRLTTIIDSVEWRVSIPCARCGALAAEIAFRRSSIAGQGQLTRSGFSGEPTIYGDFETLSAFATRIQAGDLSSADASEGEFLAFFCRACRKPYCETCWQTVGIEFDEGFYDYTTARCPEGHDQIVDD